MAIQLTLRKGTKIQNDAFTGAAGELTYDSTSKNIRIHDGSTQGGVGFVDPIVEFQTPTAENNYTWYRKYKSGWVEQGGRVAGEGNATLKQVSLPIQMADTNYTVFTTPLTDSTATSIDRYMSVSQLTTTSIGIYVWSDISKLWQVSGMAA